MSEQYRNRSVGSGKYRTPTAQPNKGKAVVRGLLVLLILALLAGGAAGVFLLQDEKPFAAYGDKGSANVMALQQWLTRLGCYDGGITGDFDAATYDAYWDYCTTHGLSASRDSDGGLVVSLAEFEAMTACTAVPTASPSPTHTGYITPTPTAEPTATPSPTPTADANSTHAAASDFTITTYDNGTCEITGYTGSESHLIIPAEIDGRRVASIGKNVFRQSDTLVTVKIPDSVTSIGFAAFTGCVNLTSVDLPNGIATIDAYAFAYCHSLTTISIPTSVTSIGNGAFSGCWSLPAIPLAEGSQHYQIIANALVSNDGMLLSYPAGADTSAYRIPTGITSLGNSAFADCNNLTSIFIPDSVTTIGMLAFESCDSLTSVTIPSSVTSIEYNAFSKCPNLTLHVTAGSCAEQYAIDNGIPYTTY